MKVLNNLKVKTKILLIVLLGVFSVFLVSIPTIFELNSSVDRIIKAEDLSRLDRRFHNMRIQEKNFMLRHDEVSLNNHEIYYDESMKVIDELSKKFKNPQNLEALANIKESMQKYREKFLIYIKNMKVLLY
ncbi:CHASE3 domain-containing protein [Halarcobacter anaerophilus]|uniref:CHASE3 domain-containing protein n=1 Tax=Halarcobacter anaerophilus TaxID=877500 RepID=UPI0005C99F2C|nr:methyl-accepting chemotaxis protein [Halarcobacter anaerophilus]